MKTLLSPLLLACLLTIGSCKSKSDPQPAIADTDVLMQANGYWQWESSVTLGAQLTPASTGFSRELIFKNDGLLHIYHDRQPFIQPPYELSTGTLTQCGASPQPIVLQLVRYTAEPQIPNNELRTYSIRLSPTDTALSITGAAACMDAGYYEMYRWRRH